MKICIGQINTIPGDFRGNFKRIKKGIDTLGASENKDMVVFPELSICGYPSRDLFFYNSFTENNLKYLYRIAEYSKKYPNRYVVVGYVEKNTTGYGKPFKNMLAVIRDGLIIGSYQKWLLPFYDIFEEDRYFEPGKDLLILNIENKRVGFTICADIWNYKGQEFYDYNYREDPVEEYLNQNVDMLINISSSPYMQEKQIQRLSALQAITTESKKKLTIVYANQTGGNDSTIFDGQSCLVNGDEFLIKEIKDYSKDSYQIFDTEEKGRKISQIERVEIEEIYKILKCAIKDYVQKSGFGKVVIGASGGIDSSLIAALASDALGPENVHCIIMPSIYSSKESVEDAKELIKNLGCSGHEVSIEHQDFLNHINSKTSGLGNYNKIADENIQARLRGNVVMHFSNAFGHLALSTGNKTETAVGYCTLYGDMVGGLSPISDLYKHQVYELADYINKVHKKEIIPKNIFEKAPSAELSENQTDEESLLPYTILDQIVRSHIEFHIDQYYRFSRYAEREGNKELIEWIKKPNSKKEYYKIIKMIENSEFKRRQGPPGIKLSRVAFGNGRKYPIVKKIERNEK